MAMAPRPPMSMPTNMRLLHIRSSLILSTPTMHKRQHTRDEEEHAIHDPKRKARLQHRALFVRSEMQSVETRSKHPDIDAVG